MSNYIPSSKIETGIGPITDRILNSIIEKINSTEFKTRVNDKVILPVARGAVQKAKPYIYLGLAMYLVLVVLLIIIVCILLRPGHRY